MVCRFDPSQAQALVDGTYTRSVFDAWKNPGTISSSQAINVHERLPTITMAAVPTVTATSAKAGITFSGTVSGVDNQPVVLQLIDENHKRDRRSRHHGWLRYLVGKALTDDSAGIA